MGGILHSKSFAMQHATYCSSGICGFVNPNYPG
jgi:hypothetical protein